MTLNTAASARRTAAAAGFVLFAACAALPPKKVAPQPDRPAPAAADASYDFHPLLLAPFGTRLVDSPVRLHEVLLFHEQSPGSTEFESRDCYSVDGAPPSFLNQRPEEYLMCFEHDRLARIDAAVRVAADGAARDFGHACATWLRNVPQVPPMGDACAGRDGDIVFSARLEALPDEHAAVLRVSLTDATTRDAQREPPDDSTAPSPAAP
jgi:hypothetical protein